MNKEYWARICGQCGHEPEDKCHPVAGSKRRLKAAIHGRPAERIHRFTSATLGRYPVDVTIRNWREAEEQHEAAEVDLVEARLKLQAIPEITPAIHVLGKRAHSLKVTDKFYEDLVSGTKTFEIRFADRDFKVGDLLYLNKVYTPNFGVEVRISGEGIVKKISYLLADHRYVKEGTVVMGLADVEEEKSLDMVGARPCPIQCPAHPGSLCRDRPELDVDRPLARRFEFHPGVHYCDHHDGSHSY